MITVHNIELVLSSGLEAVFDEKFSRPTSATQESVCICFHNCPLNFQGPVAWRMAFAGATLKHVILETAKTSHNDPNGPIRNPGCIPSSCKIGKM